MSVSLPVPALTEDRLLGGRLRLMQPARGYRAAVDPILLAAACPMKAGQTVLDMGVGTGAALLALARRVGEGGRFLGLEVRPEIAAIACRNAVLNGIPAEVVAGDVRRPPFAPDSVDHVVTNPPYVAGGTPPPDPAKATAHMESGVSLRDWLRGCLYVLRARGWITIIQRADRVDEVIAGLAGRCGAVSIFPVWSHEGAPARRVIVPGPQGGAVSGQPARGAGAARGGDQVHASGGGGPARRRSAFPGHGGTEAVITLA